MSEAARESGTSATGPTWRRAGSAATWPAAGRRAAAGSTRAPATGRRRSATSPVDLTGTVYFAGESPQWGGGVAFYDPAVPGVTAARGYLVTAGQLVDVVAQEMYREPVDGDPLEELVTRPLPGGRHVFGDGRYESVVEVGRVDGMPLLTFTSPHGSEHVERTPAGGVVPRDDGGGPPREPGLGRGRGGVVPGTDLEALGNRRRGARARRRGGRRHAGRGRGRLRDRGHVGGVAGRLARRDGAGGTGRVGARAAARAGRRLPRLRARGAALEARRSPWSASCRRASGR